MAFSQWRKFNFFERELLKDPNTKESFNQLKDLTITTSASGRGLLLFGDEKGNLITVSRELVINTFKIYELNVTHLLQLKQHSILVSIGQDEQGIDPLVKVWNFDKPDRFGNPTCVRIFRALAGNKAIQVSCLAVHENLSQMAIGFVDGTIAVIKGDVTNSRHSKQRTIHEDKFAITGLAYKQVGNRVILYAATTETVMSFNLSAKDRRELLDEFGTGFHCSAISDVAQENEFVIANSDALYFYQPESRGPCLAFQGEKKMVSWFRGYLIVVSTEMKQLPRSAGSGLGMNILSIYDIENKFIAYSGPFPDIIAVLGEWGSLHVVTADGKLFQLEEKDTQTKLETLFRKNMYDMAINLAKSQHYSDGLIEIFRQYGDHLYSKGNHDGAIQQYIRTIGHLEPSYVIRKFLDAQRIHNLTEYLQALHEKGLANTDHTTLLLNCYTKLKAVQKLNEFIQTDKELNFDVETAIKVCRQAGYYEHALELSERFEQHDWYLKIQLEDIKDYPKALKYMQRLPFLEAEANLKNYGKTLVNNVPEETTELLKQLCTDYQPVGVKKDKPNVAPPVSESPVASALVAGTIIMNPVPHRTIKRAHPDDFIHIFVHQKPKLKEFLEHMVKMRSDCSNITYNTLLELYLFEAAAANAQKDYKKGADEESKALNLLINTESKYDVDHAMVLAQMHNFKKGILFLYEKTKSFQQILRYHIEHDDYDAIIEDCQKYGAKDPSLWSQALSYFSKKEEYCKSHIIEVLNRIFFPRSIFYLLSLEVLKCCQCNSYTVLLLYTNFCSAHTIKNYIKLCKPAELPNFADRILCCVVKSVAEKFVTGEGFQLDWRDFSHVSVFLTSLTTEFIVDCSYSSKRILLFTAGVSFTQHRFTDIDKNNLLSPLLVIETLAYNSTATLGVVKDYVIRRIQQENEQIAKDERMIRKYREDTEKMRTQIEELKTCAKIFQSSKCMICSRPLELPAVHFLCGDSFHHACFESYSESDNECPVCTPENRKVMDIIRDQEHNKDLHEQFHHQLERSVDGFSVVADYFGRGVFKKVTVYTDTKTQQPLLPNDPVLERETLFS